LSVTVDDVRRALFAAGPVPSVSIGDDPESLPGQDNTACLWRRVDGSWLVGWFERGAFHDAQTFTSESAACRSFLDLLGLTLAVGWIGRLLFSTPTPRPLEH
jgi:hypothetical protein